MRIISLVPSATETLYELGLWNQVVGITTFCTMPPEAVRGKQKVGGTKNPDVEQIVALKPDIVVMNSEENRKEHADALRAHGIPLYVTHPRTVEDAASMVAGFGHEFGAEAKSKAMADEILGRIQLLHPPRRYRALVFVWNDPYMTACRNTYVDSVCRLHGLDNCIEDAASPYPVVTDRDIDSLQPEVLLLPDEPYAFREKHAQGIRDRFPSIPAVRNSHILLFNGMYLTWHGFGTLRMLREFPAVLKDAGLW